MASVRKADIEDVPTLIRLGYVFHAAAGLEETQPFDPVYLGHTLRRMIRAPNGCVLVCCEGDTILGTAGFVTTRSFFSRNALMAHENFWWVAPEYRGHGVGYQLLKALEGAARDMKCTHMVMIALEALSPDRVGTFYGEHDYDLQEHIYMKRL